MIFPEEDVLLLAIFGAMIEESRAQDCVFGDPLDEWESPDFRDPWMPVSR